MVTSCLYGDMCLKYAIADIHGCCKTFEKLLIRSQLRKCDTLYLLGDYVDRGPDSCGVLTLIMGLLESGYDVRPLRGNHDDMMLRTGKNLNDYFSDFWLLEWGVVVITSFGVKDLSDIPARYLNFLDSLQLVEETPDYIFVHASLDAGKDDPVRESSPNTMLWDTTQHIGGLSGKTLVTGHVTQSLSAIHASLKTGHILLYNGCCFTFENGQGNLVMLNLDTKELTVQGLVDEIGISS